MSTTTSKIHHLPQSRPQTAHGRKVVIAVDGPSASGKGTLAKMMAQRLNYAYLDTGALYRAVALATLEMGGDPSRFEDVEPALAIVLRHLTPELLTNPELRSHEVSEAASKVAAIPDLRLHLIDYQREFAQNPPGDVGGAVLDGRDIGTVICPDADLKLFVTASPEERARRRYEELKYISPGLSLDKILEDIKVRDLRDSTRKVAPTKTANDAYVLDTTSLNASEALEEAIAILQAKFVADSEDLPPNT